MPGPERIKHLRAELSERFDADDVDYLLETEQEQWALNDTATYLDLGTDDAETEAAYAQRCAESLGWQFERMTGDAALLRDLLWGRWDDERFQVIDPGCQLGQSPDESVMRSDPVPPGTGSP